MILMTAPLFPLHQAQKSPVPVSARSTTTFNTNNRLIQDIKAITERDTLSDLELCTHQPLTTTTTTTTRTSTPICCTCCCGVSLDIQLAQAQMVLITSIPQILDSKHKIRQFVSFVPGSIVDKKHKKDIEGASAVIPLLTLEELVPPVKRLKHKAGFLGMCGTEVDTIEWCAKEIGRLNREIDKWRKMLSGKTNWHEPLRMVDKWMEVNSKDIVWHNLDDNALEMHGPNLDELGSQHWVNHRPDSLEKTHFYSFYTTFELEHFNMTQDNR
ncbi:duf221 family protein [Moniliophthora roreri]|nr:duf221 family protein [Moniliophthora roreri]